MNNESACHMQLYMRAKLLHFWLIIRKKIGNNSTCNANITGWSGVTASQEVERVV